MADTDVKIEVRRFADRAQQVGIVYRRDSDGDLQVLSKKGEWVYVQGQRSLKEDEKIEFAEI